MRAYLTTKAAVRIYKAMIVPLMSFNKTKNLNLSITQKHRLSSIDRRARQMIGWEGNLEAVIKKDACTFAKKWINNKICENYENYFGIITHNKNTTQGLLLRLPKNKIEMTKNAFVILELEFLMTCLHMLETF